MTRFCGWERHQGSSGLSTLKMIHIDLDLDDEDLLILVLSGLITKQDTTIYSSEYLVASNRWNEFLEKVREE